MKKYKKARKMALILASVLVLDSYMGMVSPYIDGYAYTEKAAAVNATSLNVRSGPGTSYSIVTKLTNGASVTVIDEKNASDGALWYQIRVTGSGGQAVTGYVSKSYLRFPAAYTSNADFESKLTAEGFPESYKVRLRELHALYPGWVFKAQHTNLDWNAAIKEQSKVGKNLVHTSSLSSWKSTESGAYNWDTSSWIGYDGSSWVTASEDIVKYYMDPRNFLDETNVFQFLTHTYDGNKQTAAGLETMVKGSFLSGQSSVGASSGSGSPDSNSEGSSGGSGPASPVGPGEAIGPGETEGSGNVSLEGPQASISLNKPDILMVYGPGANLPGPSSPGTSGGSGTTGTTGTVTGSSSYVSMIMNAAAQSGVNPYVLAAMIIQEQGSSGAGKSVSGSESGYEGYYNFFNIEAYQSGTMSAVQRGLWWASQAGSYNRPWNSPESSILGGAFYYGNNYVKVGQDTFYLKKFNVQGANIHKHQYMTNVQGAASEGAVFSKAYNSDMKKTALEFKIPVYNNMPDNACSQPTGTGSPNNKLSGLSVSGLSLTPSFSRDTMEYNLIVDPSVTNITVNASPLDSGASVGGAGNITLQSGNNDIKIAITAQNGTVREYVLHVVRQNGGPTSSPAAPDGSSPGNTSGSTSGNTTGNTSGNTSSGGSSAGPGGSIGPGVSKPSTGASEGTPGGSNVTIAPDGSSGMSSHTSGSAAVIGQGPGSVQVTDQMTVSRQPQPEQTAAAGTSSPQPSSGGAGDINGDGKINSLDVLKLQRFLLGLETLTAGGQKSADLNGDGKVNSQDILLLQKKVLGL